jgi:hypothetical protein
VAQLRILIIFFFVARAGSLVGQDADPGPGTDNSMNARLTADLNKRIPETKNNQLTWRPTKFGFFTTFTIENIDYMSVYDKQGHYRETLEKRSWDDRVPENIRLEFGNSPYSLCSVITFWEATQTYNKDYYFELMDREGQSRYAWSDENGKFSDQPGFFR